MLSSRISKVFKSALHFGELVANSYEFIPHSYLIYTFLRDGYGWTFLLTFF